jgi:hypothetical protein
MLFVEVNPRKYKAVQFNKFGDVTGVYRGYIETKGSTVQYFVSDVCPRRMDCRFAYLTRTQDGFQEVKEGDWILTNTKNGKIKILPNKKFLKDYVGYHEPAQSPEPVSQVVTLPHRISVAQQAACIKQYETENAAPPL